MSRQSCMSKWATSDVVDNAFLQRIHVAEVTHSETCHVPHATNEENNQLEVLPSKTVEESQKVKDAQHWVATVHFLRTMTKGFFGQYDNTGLKGNPPQILHLSGYGMHMFNRVPVVINQFNIRQCFKFQIISPITVLVFKVQCTM